MTDFTPDAATRAQIGAADPEGSVWLAANAGSGKTRVLTDRVAWLLLDGTAPEKILCLTYTKAAAGEMQNRLFKRLGEWAMLSDDELRDQITRLGAGRGTIPTEQLKRARTLFARAIETPGGLKIQTIHAFCASLLRRFPLEAGVSPNFSEMDETATARLHADVLDDMAADPAMQPMVDGIARRLTDGEPSDFLRAVAANRDGFVERLTRDDLRAKLGIVDESPDAVRNATLGSETLDLLENFIDHAENAPGASVLKVADAFKQARLTAIEDRLDLLVPICLTGEGAKRKTTRWPAAVKDGIHGPLVELYGEIGDIVIEARTRIAAFEALAQTEALHAFGPAFAAEVQARKQARGWLDFDDQINRAKRLLSESSMAQWVLFKLDGGLDHILVDEAQDTSPAQWDVIQRLTDEFNAGASARSDVRRTVFIVGDRKQSIYAFQGADLAAFDQKRNVFADKLRGHSAPMQDHALLHSFRSSPVILDLVDEVFRDGGGVGDAPEHIAFKSDMPGRVDLWPAVVQEKPDTSDREWFDPVDRPAANEADVILAKHVANEIQRMIKAGTPIGEGDKRRPVQAGDILILLQRRKKLFHHIVRECKALGLDLAGADRLKLSDDMAVKDLIAALTWAATPDDDLSLATVLRSPLGSVDEPGLFALAYGRGKRRLWDVLRDAGSDSQTTEMLADLLRIADILRPYEVLQRILIRHNGRRRLQARLGDEAGEAIDALLAQALSYEQLETPSLTGFLGWVASADVDVKRQAGAGSIRVMSVHGSKGLEAPVVILPETMKRAPKVPQGVQRLDDETVVWMPSKAYHAPKMAQQVEQAQAAVAAERDRLLYVAMTRAESWLIVGAAGDVGVDENDSWYKKIQAAMVARGAGPVTFEGGQGLRLETGDWTPLDKGAPPRKTGTTEAPDWLGKRVPPPAKVATRIAPSGLAGAKALPGETGLDTEAALRRGTAIHVLLEHLPRLPRADWTARADAILAANADLAGDDPAPLLAEALTVLDAPDLAHIFAPGTLAEVPFALPATDRHPAIFGTIDRVIVEDTRITLVDFKTNAILPSTPADTPQGILRQIAAYRIAAQAIWPGRAVSVQILWTKGPSLMELPHDLVTDLGPAIDPVGLPA
ncbi:DNA helicase/exodeoxyribonuclease V, subunit A [Jannaschia faecimaris]|uniref:DNA 3'-5' helicase n=2 Tax=Jannaschia faecimaris TaxID=1244108 RepID=A0A1H3IIW2_9RHOB|nr:DNA helicase/exodeoxyribonuclease V, subunit A [Jannaschia faecimaris]